MYLRTSMILAAVFFSLSVAAGQNVQRGIRNDLEVYEAGPAPKLPPAGETFTDPVFGTTILRVTDDRDGRHSHVAYSYWPTFNRDSTRFHISVAGAPTLYEFDPEQLRIGGRQPLFEPPTPAGGRPRWEDAIWSGTEPNIIFAHDMRRLWAYDVVTQEYQLLKEFDGQIAQMSRSIDDNVFAFSRRFEDGGQGCLVWNRQTDQILEERSDSLDEVQIDKSGRYLLIKTGQQGRGKIEARVADLRTGRTADLTDDEPDFAPGHSDNGHDSVIGHDNWRNQLSGRRLSAPHQHFTVLDLKSDWRQGLHVSMLADDERWVMISFYGDQAGEVPFRGEIIQVATDGSQRVRRLAHHRTVTSGEYWKIPLANISRDGRFVAFTSNFDNSGQTDVFILVVPPFTAEEQYPIDRHPLRPRE
jgi:hypothetical protein